MTQPASLHERAADNLQYIRETMERAASFTAVPGKGGAGMGVSAVVFGLLAARQPTQELWLRVWLVELVIGFCIGAASIYLKARRSTVPLFSSAGRKFILAFAPPVAAAGVLTVAMVAAHSYALLPGTWLLLYGAGVSAGGSASIRLIPIMGAAFCALGVVALALPDWGNAAMIAGFGLVQIVFGVMIARRHGG